MVRIKIKDHDRKPHLSIAVVVAAAALIWVAWLLWSFDHPLVIGQRLLHQVQAPYLCGAGHMHEAPAGPRSLLCPIEGCEERSWPVWTYQCSRDGGYVLQLRYADGTPPRIRKVRVPGGAWQDVDGEIRCIQCERPMQADLSLRARLVNPAF